MSLALEPILGSPLLVGAIVLGIAVAVLGVLPTGGELTAGRRRTLVGLRLAALALLLLGMLRPAVVRSDTRPAAATLAVLLDLSRSMTLSDGEGSPRWAVQRQVWEQLGPAILGADSALEVQTYGYDAAPQPIPPEAVSTRLAEEPRGEVTDLSAALRGALTGAAGRPLAGVVLLGDGTDTTPTAAGTGSASAAGPQSVARILRSLDVPLWTVPIGPRGDEATARDVAIDGVQEEFTVFTRNRFTVEATVEARGLAGTEIPVRVRLIDADERSEEVGVRRVVPQRARDVLPLSIELTAPEAGSYRLEVEADAQAGEILTTNNRQTAFLEVRDGGGRILYLEGEASQEQLFLRRALGDSPDLEIRWRWIERDSDRTGNPPQWPVDLGDAFAPNQFDVYVIGDLDAAALGTAQLEQLAQRVEAGAGLLLLGGYQSFDVGGYAQSPLEPLIPFRMDPSLRRPPGSQPPSAASLDGPVEMRIPRAHPITNLAGNGDAQIWNSLRPLLGANRLGDPKPLPGVQVLAESPEGDPLLVVGQSGQGRVAAFAGDSTWQWWRQGRSDVHRRFWRQMLLWLLARDAPPADQVWVQLDARRFERREPPEFTAGIQTLREDLQEIALEATVIAADNTVTAIDLAGVADAGAGGGGPRVRGTLPDLPSGLYRLRVGPRGAAAEESAESLAASEVPFQVIEIDREMSRPLADVVQMEQLAALTAESGGRAFGPDEIDALIDTLRQTRRQAEVPIVEKWRLADDPWSGWLLFLALIGTFTTEWLLRRRWGLA